MLIPVLQEHCRPNESERISFRSVESRISERNWQFPVFLHAGIGTIFSEDLGIPQNNCSSALETPPRTEREAHTAAPKAGGDCACDRDPMTGEVYRSSEVHFAAAAIIVNDVEDDASLFSENRFAPSSMLVPDLPGRKSRVGGIQ